MPLYEYQCRNCKHRFERIQRFSDPILKSCPKCGGTVDQLLSAPAVRFKGSGWYATDYARKGFAKSAHSEKDHEVAEPAADKPAEKAEPKPKSEKKSHEKKK
jgi:putative FmdB family regulatory protein